MLVLNVGSLAVDVRWMCFHLLDLEVAISLLKVQFLHPVSAP